MTLKLDDNRCRIHSISDGNVTNQRDVVIRWKMVTRHGMNITLKEAVDRILNQKKSEAKERKKEIESEKKLETSVKNIMRHI